MAGVTHIERSEQSGQCTIKRLCCHAPQGEIITEVVKRMLLFVSFYSSEQKAGIYAIIEAILMKLLILK